MVDRAPCEQIGFDLKITLKVDRVFGENARFFWVFKAAFEASGDGPGWSGTDAGGELAVEGGDAEFSGMEDGLGDILLAGERRGNAARFLAHRRGGAFFGDQGEAFFGEKGAGEAGLKAAEGLAFAILGADRVDIDLVGDEAVGVAGTEGGARIYADQAFGGVDQDAGGHDGIEFDPPVDHGAFAKGLAEGEGQG
jgi:hypothetical protein